MIANHISIIVDGCDVQYKYVQSMTHLRISTFAVAFLRYITVFRLGIFHALEFNDRGSISGMSALILAFDISFFSSAIWSKSADLARTRFRGNGRRGQWERECWPWHSSDPERRNEVFFRLIDGYNIHRDCVKQDRTIYVLTTSISISARFLRLHFYKLSLL